eukprot:2230179-Rhodomonas_salina.1
MRAELQPPTTDDSGRGGGGGGGGSGSRGGGGGGGGLTRSSQTTPRTFLSPRSPSPRLALSVSGSSTGGMEALFGSKWSGSLLPAQPPLWQASLLSRSLDRSLAFSTSFSLLRSLARSLARSRSFSFSGLLSLWARPRFSYALVRIHLYSLLLKPLLSGALCFSLDRIFPLSCSISDPACLLFQTTLILPLTRIRDLTFKPHTPLPCDIRLCPRSGDGRSGTERKGARSWQSLGQTGPFLRRAQGSTHTGGPTAKGGSTWSGARARACTLWWCVPGPNLNLPLAVEMRVSVPRCQCVGPACQSLSATASPSPG